MQKNVFCLILIYFVLCLANAQKPNVRQLKQYPDLKAVLVVGYQEDNTANAISVMNNIAERFESYGVKVYKFYNDKAVWDKIKVEAANSHFFVYSGHGSVLGRNKVSGGLVLTEMVSVEKMVKELKFTKHPLVLFQSVCLGAGSSAGDDTDIGIKLAEQRVTDYSLPFFEMGASAYFANNTNGACAKFINYFFQEKPIQVCYGLTTDTVTYMFGLKITKSNQVAKIELDKPYQPKPEMRISICSSMNNNMVTRTSYINGKKKVEQVPSVKSYGAAYVGLPDFTITKLIELCKYN